MNLVAEKSGQETLLTALPAAERESLIWILLKTGSITAEDLYLIRAGTVVVRIVKFGGRYAGKVVAIVGVALILYDAVKGGYQAWKLGDDQLNQLTDRNILVLYLVP